MKIEIILAKLAAEGSKPAPSDLDQYAKTQAGYPSVNHSMASEAKPMSFVGALSGRVFGGNGTRTYSTILEPVPDTPSFAGYKGHDSAHIWEGEGSDGVWDHSPVIGSSKPPAELNPPGNTITARNAAIALAAALGAGGIGYGAYRMLRKKRTKTAAEGANPMGPNPAAPKVTGGPPGPPAKPPTAPPAVPLRPSSPAPTPRPAPTPAAPPKPPKPVPGPVPPMQPARPAAPPAPAPGPGPQAGADPMAGMLGFLQNMKPEQIGQFMGAMQPVTKGIAGAAGIPGLAAVADLTRGGENIKTLLAGDPNRPRV